MVGTVTDAKSSIPERDMSRACDIIKKSSISCAPIEGNGSNSTCCRVND